MPLTVLEIRRLVFHCTNVFRFLFARRFENLCQQECLDWDWMNFDHARDSRHAVTVFVRLSFNRLEASANQRSNAKIHCHFRFSLPRTLQEFEKKTYETSVGKCYKSSTVRKVICWEPLRMSISTFSGHMRSIKLNFSATALTLGFRAKIFENLRLCKAKVLAGTAHVQLDHRLKWRHKIP